jgi:hypothetical protein
VHAVTVQETLQEVKGEHKLAIQQVLEEQQQRESVPPTPQGPLQGAQWDRTAGNLVLLDTNVFLMGEQVHRTDIPRSLLTMHPPQAFSVARLLREMQQRSDNLALLVPRYVVIELDCQKKVGGMC